MEFIRGSERILYAKENGTGTWLPIGCLIGNEWNKTTSFLETTTRTGGKYKTRIPITHDYEINFSAVLPTDEFLTDKAGLKQIREWQDAGTFLDWKLEALGRNFTDAGFCYIANTNEGATVDGLIEYSATLLGHGETYDPEDVTPPTDPFLTVQEINSTIPYVILEWDAVTDNLQVAGYEIRKLDTTQPEQIIDVGNVLEYQDFSVAYALSYGYNVRAYDLAGNYSNWSNKRLVTIALPQGQNAPNYFIYEDGANIALESGNLLELE